MARRWEITFIYSRAWLLFSCLGNLNVDVLCLRLIYNDGSRKASLQMSPANKKIQIFFFFFLKIRRYRFWNVLNWLANAKNFSSLRYVYLVKDEKKSLGITYKQDEMIACIFALTSNAFLEDWKWLSPPLRFEKINNLVFSLTMVREYFKFWKVFLDQTLPMISENLFS